MIVRSPAARALHLVHLAVVDDAAVERDQAIAAPDLVIRAGPLEERNRKEPDLALDFGVDHQSSFWHEKMITCRPTSP